MAKTNSNNQRVLTPSLSALTENRSSSLFAQGYASPWRGLGPAGDEDAFYYTVANFFDPRAQQRGSSWTLNAGFNLEDFALQLLERRFSRVQSNYPVPEPAVIAAMLDTICDVSRMLGIAMTYHQCEASLDSDLIQRNRDFQLNRNLRAMHSVIARLPLPSFMKQMIVYYNRLVNISSGSPTYVGFLTVGDYNAFLALYDTVKSGSPERRRAFVELLRMYPEIGEVGLNVATGDEIPTLTEAFINANTKRESPSTRECYYTAVSGANPNNVALYAAGFLRTVQTYDGLGTPEGLYTLSRFALPGTGNGGVGTQTYNFPSICRYGNGTDAQLTSLNLSYSGAVPAATVPESVDQNENLQMFAIQHNIAANDARPYEVPTLYDAVAGEATALQEYPIGGIPWPNGSQKAAGGHSIGNVVFKEDANSIHLIRLMFDEVR